MEQYDIFISYRREGGRDHARSVVLALGNHGYKNIFFDFDSLRNGVFNEQIIDAINNCKDFILVLSEHSMDRCSNQEDWVAREIRTAISSGCNIIPLVVGEFSDFPSDFPRDLKVLRNFQRSKLMTDEYFDDSIKRLVKRLDSIPNALTPSNERKAVAIGSEIHIKVDADCQMLDYGKVIVPQISQDKDTIVVLKKGFHDLEFISKKEPSVSKSLEYTVPDNESVLKLQVKLQSEVDRVKNARLREEERSKKVKDEEEKHTAIIKKEADYNDMCNRLKEKLPSKISFALTDNIDVTFKLSYDKTEYRLKKSVVTEKLNKASQSGNASINLLEAAAGAVIPYVAWFSTAKSVITQAKDEFVNRITVDDKISQMLDAENLFVEINKYDYVIPVFKKWSHNLEYFKAKFL